MDKKFFQPIVATMVFTIGIIMLIHERYLVSMICILISGIWGIAYKLKKRKVFYKKIKG